MDFPALPPFVGLVLAITLLWGWGFSWVHLGTLLGMYVITALGVTLRAFRVSATTNFDAVFADVTKDGANAIFCLGGVLPTPVMKAIVDHAAQARLPAMYPLGDYVVLGGLMSHTYRNGEIFRAAATYVVQILRGAKPGDLPLTIWTKYYLTLNATTAASLGITLAPALLAQVDEVVK